MLIENTFVETAKLNSAKDQIMQKMTVKFAVNNSIVLLFCQKDGNKLIVFGLVRRFCKNSKCNYKIEQMSFLPKGCKGPASRENNVSFQRLLITRG